jgi:hypothetical protein
MIRTFGLGLLCLSNWRGACVSCFSMMTELERVMASVQVVYK